MISDVDPFVALVRTELRLAEARMTDRGSESACAGRSGLRPVSSRRHSSRTLSRRYRAVRGRNPRPWWVRALGWVFRRCGL